MPSPSSGLQQESPLAPTDPDGAEDKRQSGKAEGGLGMHAGLTPHAGLAGLRPSAWVTRSCPLSLVRDTAPNQTQDGREALEHRRAPAQPKWTPKWTPPHQEVEAVLAPATCPQRRLQPSALL